MKKLLLIIFLAAFGASYGQTVTGSKTRFPGIWWSSKDTANATSADSIVVLANRGDQSLYFRWANSGLWSKLTTSNGNDFITNQWGFPLSSQTAKFYISDTGRARLFYSQKFLGDSLQASSSAGFNLLSNGGTVVSQFGVGGSANMDFHGFAGYDANRSSSYTSRSFTDKNYVDSADDLRVKYTDTASMLAGYAGLHRSLNSFDGGMVIAGTTDGIKRIPVAPFRSSANLELQANGPVGAEIDLRQLDYRYEVPALVAVHADRYGNSWHQGSINSVWIKDTGTHKYSIFGLNAVYDSIQKEIGIIHGSGYMGTVLNSSLYDGSDLPGMNRMRMKGYIQADSLDDRSAPAEYLVAWNQSDGKFRKEFPYTSGAGISINSSNVISNIGVTSVLTTSPILTTGGTTPTISILASAIPFTGTTSITTATAGASLSMSGDITTTGVGNFSSLTVTNNINVGNSAYTGESLIKNIGGTTIDGNPVLRLVGNTSGRWTTLHLTDGITSDGLFGYLSSATSTTRKFKWSADGVDLATLDGTGAFAASKGSFTKLIGTSSAPSISADAGAGTSPTVSISGTDMAGEITVTTGTSCPTGSDIVTVTFNSAYSSSPYVVFSASNSAAAAIETYATATTTTFKITMKTGFGLLDATTYKFMYHVIQ